MQDFIIALLVCSITMSALALFYMAITPLVKKYFSEKGRYYAWLIIVIGLIIPFRPQFNNTIIQIDIPNGATTPTVQIGNETFFTIPDNITIPDNVIIPTDIVPGDNPALLSTTTSFLWWQIGFAVWLAGIIAFLAFYFIKHFRFIKFVKRWSKSIADEQVLSLLQSLKIEMGIFKKIKLYQCSDLGSPMMFGFMNPRILLPNDELANDELRFILKHELVHYKQKDLYFKSLVLIATAMHWFNPFVYLIAKAINSQCELSCDAEIVRNTDADTRLQYSETIIGVIKNRSKLKTAFSTNFYGGKKGMKNRISSIMDIRKKRFGFLVISIIIVATLCAGFVFASDGNGATVNTIPSGVPNFVMPFDTMLPTDDTMSSNARIENRPNVSYTPIRTIDAWIDAQLVAYQEFAEKTLVDYHEFAEKTIEENRIWAEAQVTASGNSPEKREWADEWIASRYEWAEEWIAGRHEWSKEWIAERYEWATEMRDLYDKGLITIIRDENGNIVRLEIVE